MSMIFSALLASIRLSAPVAPAPPSTGVGGLMPIAALAALPRPAIKPIRGYPGSSLRAGAIRSQAVWKAFAAKAGRRYRNLSIDWRRQMVVYVVFTGQTNALRFRKWVAPRKGRAELHLDWDGIEPFYLRATPGLFRVVLRRGVHHVTVRDHLTGGGSRVVLSFRVR